MSKIEYIKDGNGQIIGQKRGDLIQQNGKVIGQFFKGSNLTKNASGEVIGRGDQRLTLLKKKK